MFGLVDGTHTTFAVAADDLIAADESGDCVHCQGWQGGPDLGGRAVQKLGLEAGPRIEVQKFFHSGTQVGVATALEVEKNSALQRLKIGRLQEQRLHGFGRWFGHIPSVFGLAS